MIFEQEIGAVHLDTPDRAEAIRILVERLEGIGLHPEVHTERGEICCHCTLAVVMFLWVLWCGRVRVEVGAEGAGGFEARVFGEPSLLKLFAMPGERVYRTEEVMRALRGDSPPRPRA